MSRSRVGKKPKDFYRREYPIQRAVYAHNQRIYDYIVRELGAESVFEFGCNAGRNLLQLRGRGLRVGGVDLGHEAVAEARRMGLDVSVGDEKSLHTVESDSYDVALTVSVLCHIEKIDGILVDLARIAKGNVLMVETLYHAPESFYWRHKYPGDNLFSFTAVGNHRTYSVWHLRGGA